MNVSNDIIPTGVSGIAQRLQTGPRIAQDVFIASTAVVVGDVILSEGCSVWFGAVLRGDINRITVAGRSNIQDCAVVHLADDFPVVIGELVTVGHSAVVHACTIGDEVLIGMGAVVLDGAEIGARCIIGANSLVPTGMKVPSGSLVVGSPARIVRQLPVDEQNAIARWALKYVETSKRFREFYVSNPHGPAATGEIG